MLKTALGEAMATYFPDYNLEWIIRVDASDYVVGAVLYQIRVDTIKKEAYGCYFGVRYFDYYLRGKAFILETDHRN